MRTVVFGAKGQLGRDLVARFRQEGEVLGVDLPEVDIADARAVESVCQAFHPDRVINAAAYTDVEGAEDDEAGAFRVNEAGAAHVAAAAAQRGIPVLYYSTDYVFDGTKQRPYEPDDPVAPLCGYGRSKAAGEAATRSASPRHFIVRTAWLYGPGGNNFVEKILRAAASRPNLKVVSDEVGSPTHTWDLAEATAAVFGTNCYGTYHAVNMGACSRDVFARAILRCARRDVAVAACPSSAFPTKARRPAYSVLSNARLEQRVGHQMRPWEEALESYMKRRQDRE
jgi:dTDP-4-dehydrorhamnose reductase